MPDLIGRRVSVVVAVCVCALVAGGVAIGWLIGVIIRAACS